MSDPRSFKPQGPFTAAQLAEATNSTLAGVHDPDRKLHDVAALFTATPNDLAFLDNPKYAKDLAGCQAGAIIVTPDMVENAPRHAVLIVNAATYKAYARIAQLFHPLSESGRADISQAARIHPTVVMGENCGVAAGAVIEAGVRLGNNVRIAANAVIGKAVEIGDDCVIGAGVTLTHCLIGHRVRILPGARIGQEGFGFAIDPAGHLRIPQMGRVIVEDDVEIGANTCIDRGAGPDTVIGRGAMIDNLVQIGHNVVVGPGCVIVAQVGISGSAKLGRGVAIGGQAGVVGHITLGDGSQIAGHSGIMRDVPPGARMMGYPAVTTREFFRQVAWLAKAATNHKKD